MLRFCREAGVNVVPRGAGTSLAGGAIPQEDAIVIGLSQDEPHPRRRITPTARCACRRASPISSISDAVSPDGFFYAPDPSSQLACTIGGNIAHEFGRRALPEVRGHHQQRARRDAWSLIDGDIVEIGGEAHGCAGLDLLGLIVGSEGQLGVVTEATVRILRAAEGARPVLFGFDSSEEAGACVAAIIGAGIVPVAMEFMDKPAIEICEAFAKAGYPLDVRGAADHRGRRLATRDGRAARAASSPSPAARRAASVKESQLGAWRRR